MSTELDLVIRNADMAIASDRSTHDTGVHGNRIAVPGRDLPRGGRELDASGPLALPDGVDGHCHLDQPMFGGMYMTDDFFTDTCAAICDGTVMAIPFAAQKKGGSLKAIAAGYHRCAKGRAVVDYGFHLIVVNPTSEVLKHELPEPIHQDYTSSKVYIMYGDLKLSGREMLDVLDVARQDNTLVMVHAENADCILWLTEKLVGEGHISPCSHGLLCLAAVECETAYHTTTFAGLVDVLILIVHVSDKEAIKQIRWM